MGILQRINSGNSGNLPQPPAGGDNQQRVFPQQPNQPAGSGGTGIGSNTSPLAAGARRGPFIGGGQQDAFADLKTRIQNKLIAELDPNTDVTKQDEVRKTILTLFEQILVEENIILSRPERTRLFEQIAAEILGFGPLQPLLEDETITEIMVNGAKSLYIERGGKIFRVTKHLKATNT